MNSADNPSPGSHCAAWSTSRYTGFGLILIGILLNAVLRFGYIASHDLTHAQLNSLDEYTESGLGKSLRVGGFGLIIGGGLLAVSGIIGATAHLPCTWLPAAVAIGLGFLLALSSVSQSSGKVFSKATQIAKFAADANKRAQESLEQKAESLNDKLPSSIKPRKISDSFKETEDSRLHNIKDDPD